MWKCWGCFGATWPRTVRAKITTPYSKDGQFTEKGGRRCLPPFFPAIRLARDYSLRDPKVNYVPDFFLVSVTLARRFAMVGPDRLPSVTKSISHISQVPSCHEHRLAAVVQVGNGDSVTGKLGQVHVIDATHAVIHGPIGVHPMFGGRVKSRFLRSYRAENPRVDVVVQRCFIKTISGGRNRRQEHQRQRGAGREVESTFVGHSVCELAPNKLLFELGFDSVSCDVARRLGVVREQDRGCACNSQLFL
jgi:hypothetical protein